MASCPIKADAEDALRTAQDFAKAMRRLRVRLNVCTECVNGLDCALMAQWNEAINQAVIEVVEEWDLGRACR